MFADNEVRPLAGEPALDDLVVALADAVAAEGVAA